MPALPRALSFSGRRRQLHGLRVLVTGASAGVGRALGLALARRGRRVLVGSILGYHPLPLHGAYCAAKAALRSLAGTLRLELEPEGIDVVLASLGPTESEFWDSLVVGARPAWSRGRPLAATTAAAAILDGLERRRREIVPGWQARGFVWAARWMPAFLDAVCRAKIRSDREDPPGATP